MPPKDLAPEFMGKVTASVTHEIQNVLAVIKESAGLMEDLTLMMNRNEGVPGMEEKLASCLDTIKKQAYRGVSLTSNLNAFAHSPDNPVSTFNPVETIQKLLGISERIFKLKGTTISFSGPDSVASLTTDPLVFQMLIFSCLEFLVKKFSPEIISVELRSDGGNTIVNLSAPADKEENIEQMPIPENISRTCQMLGGRVEITGNPAGIDLTLSNAPR
ncbi:hypothetical protein [Desulfospira joergensenii]|uniref:hypothetical protein n=1 Tax=Desulfospira joergensenii TaxID=53329 RepID=UPI0003B5E872|nr:hypothetical protein [Desulfospira joergensenii]